LAQRYFVFPQPRYDLFTVHDYLQVNPKRPNVTCLVDTIVGAARAMGHHRRNLDDFIDETRASQRNIVFPDTVRNARLADVFLWRGSADPSLVQRIAAWMFGLGFIGAGTGLFCLAVVSRSSFADVFVGVSMSVLALFMGIRIFRNGFPRSAPPS
jgi:hypothetical protein